MAASSSRVYHYEVLGVPPASNAREIRDAAHKLARKHHPDTAGTKDAARFSEITNSYAVLKVVEKRRQYDKEFQLLNKPCPTCKFDGRVSVQAGFGKVTYKVCGACHGKGHS